MLLIFYSRLSIWSLASLGTKSHGTRKKVYQHLHIQTYTFSMNSRLLKFYHKLGVYIDTLVVSSSIFFVVLFSDIFIYDICSFVDVSVKMLWAFFSNKMLVSCVNDSMSWYILINNLNVIWNNIQEKLRFTWMWIHKSLLYFRITRCEKEKFWLPSIAHYVRKIDFCHLKIPWCNRSIPYLSYWREIWGRWLNMTCF